jgi:hypothetical protein
MAKMLTITVSKDGDKVEVEADGFKGTACTDITKTLLKAIGSISKDTKKPEFYQQSNSGVKIGG